MTDNAKSTPIQHENRRRLELEVLLFSGAGFGLGFGWLWFAALQAVWLPNFLWGNLLLGGGTTLFATLCIACFFIAGAVFRRLARKAETSALTEFLPDFRTGKISGLAHGLALALTAAAVLLIDSPNVSAYPAVASLAMAAVLLGLYWVCVLLTLPPRQSAAAFAVACFFSVGIAGLAGVVPGQFRSWLLCGVIAAAWMAAFGLGRVIRQLWLLAQLLNLEALRQKRPRGRPQQPKAGLSADTQNCRHWSVPAAVAGLFFLSGLAEAGQTQLLAGKGAPPFLSAVLNSLGALLGLLILRIQHRTAMPYFRAQAAIGGAFILQGLLLLSLPSYLPYAFPVLEGAACAALFALLANPRPRLFLPRTSVQQTTARAAIFLGGAACCAHFGSLLAEHALEANGAGLVSLAVSAALLASLFWDRRRLTRYGASGESLLAQLSRRELDIAGLVRQGKSNKEISSELFIAEDTVRFHLKNIYQKTGLLNRKALRALNPPRNWG